MLKLKTVIYEKEQGVATITLNTPEKLNPLSVECYVELGYALDEAEADSDVRVIIITGAGRAFCAGDDVSELKGLVDFATTRDFIEKIMITWHKLEQTKKPIIAAVNGPAFGGGFEVALLCDITIASEEAIFMVPEPRFGVVGAISSPRLAEVVGMKKAKELLLTCATINAREALAIGLVNKVVPKEKLKSEAKAMADKIKEYAPLGISFTKIIMNRHNLMDGALDNSAKLNTLLMLTDDYKEGIDAFVNKRKPQYKSK